jgi:hypothetical protein
VTLAGEVVGFATDPDVLTEALRPYRDHVRYVHNAELTVPGDHRLVVSRSDLTIPESCYIDDTGHFNSVEFNICYNQMMYYAVAKSVKEGLLPAFSTWTLDEFWRRRLSEILITDFSSTFRQAINPREFHGEIEVTKVVERLGSAELTPMIIIYTAARFWDDDGGRCHGTVKLVVVQSRRQVSG